MSTSTIDNGTYDALRRYIETEASIALGEDKRYLLETRLRPVMQSENCRNWAELLDRAKLDRSHRIRDLIVDAMTTNETLWFRDQGPFVTLREKLLPRYADEIRNSKRDKVRIWSAACSTGQEPYSTMITALEYARTQSALKAENIEILATDISDTALAEAKGGRYNSVAMNRGLDPEIRDRYFTESGRHWEVKPQLRERITFRKMNLQDSFALLGSFDIVMMRYVTIYFSDEFKKHLFRRVHSTLNPNGVLFLGSSESLEGYSSDYVTLRHGRAVYYQMVPRSGAEALASNMKLPGQEKPAMSVPITMPPSSATPPSRPAPAPTPPAAAPKAAGDAKPADPTDLTEVLAMLRELNSKYS